MHPETCREFCGMPYRKVGISLGLLCFCIPDNWFEFDTVDEANCTDPCPSTSYPCGNSYSLYVFDMYRSTAQVPVPNIEPIIGCKPILYGPYDNLSLPYFLVNVNETFDVEIVCESGNKITFNFTMADGGYQIKMNNSINHTYTDEKTFNASCYLKNLFTDFLVVFEILVTFPLEQITGLTMNATGLAPARTSVLVEFHLDTGNGLYCVIDYGDGYSVGRNQRYYQADYQYNHFYTSPDTYEMTIICSNNISSVNVSHSIMIMENIYDLQIPSHWLFDINQVKTMLWQFVNGSHFEYEAEISGTPVSVPYRALGVDLSNTLFPTIGWYSGWLRSWNLVSYSESENFTIQIERYVAGLTIASPQYIRSYTLSPVSLDITYGSNVNFSVTFYEGQTPSVGYEAGDIANHAEPFTTSYHQNGTYRITGQAWNDLNFMNSTFDVIVQHPVLSPFIYVQNQSSLFYPVRVDTWQNASLDPATDVIVDVYAKRNGWSAAYLCYTGPHQAYTLYTAYCNLNESGVYNMSTRIHNEISDEVAWISVDIGEYISVLDYNVSHSIQEVNYEVNVTVLIDAGMGSVCSIDYGDGTVTAWTSITPTVVLAFYHTYTVPGLYNVLITATNQISTKHADCQSCVHVQAPIVGLSITGPFAFTFNTLVKVNWIMVSGTDILYGVLLGANSIAAITQVWIFQCSLSLAYMQRIVVLI